jgi:hypothetical protein
MKNLLATFALLALACFKVHAADLWTPLTSVEVVISDAEHGPIHGFLLKSDFEPLWRW